MNDAATIVLGLGATGYSCVRHLAAKRRIVAVDTRPQPPFLDAVRGGFPQVQVLVGDAWRQALDALGSAERLLVSPGVGLDHCLVAAARAKGVAIGSDIELFLDTARARATPTVGITGTNGKSTVATLVHELLVAAGVDAAAGGNLGTPALDLLDQPRQAYVLELSSFQLERLPPPGLAVASLLNLSADHLDRHADMAAYVAAKRRIYLGAERAVGLAGDPRTLPPAHVPSILIEGSDGWRLGADEIVVDGCPLPRLSFALRGRHDHANALAAAAIAKQAGVDVRGHLDVLTSFRGLPHRSALVAELDGVAYVDDSKATNVGACRAALEGFGDGAGNVVLIAGGDAKGAAFDGLREAVARHVSKLVLMGRDADVLAKDLAAAACVAYADDMGHAVRLAQAAARPGGIVLLSPACASFDAYASFEERGEHFKAEVLGLAGSGGGLAGAAR